MKLTTLQHEYQKQVNRIKNAIKRIEKSGVQLDVTLLPEMPKRITRKQVEEIKAVKPKMLRVTLPSMAGTTVEPIAPTTLAKKVIKNYNKTSTPNVTISKGTIVHTGQVKTDEETKAKRKAYYQEHKEEIKAKRKAYYQEHKEEIKAKRKAYYQEHKEEISKRAKERRQQAKQNKPFYTPPKQITPPDIEEQQDEYNTDNFLNSIIARISSAIPDSITVVNQGGREKPHILLAEDITDTLIDVIMDNYNNYGDDYVEYLQENEERIVTELDSFNEKLYDEQVKALLYETIQILHYSSSLTQEDAMSYHEYIEGLI